RFEPRAFWRHDAAGIGDGHEIFDPGREHRESTGSAVVHQLLQFSGAADAADEADALAGARIRDAEDWIEGVLLNHGDVEFFDRIRSGGETWAEVQRAPFAFEIKPELVFARRGREFGGLDDEHTVELFQKLRRRKAVEIFEHAVVGENLHLVVRENHRKELAA